MQRYLEPLQNAPSLFDSFVVFRQPDGEMFTCKDYMNLNRVLAECLMTSTKSSNFHLDWTRTVYQSLIFDIDINVKGKQIDTSNYLMHYFYDIFVDVLKKYIYLTSLTCILAMRRDRSGGLHVHVPGFAIGHDDYIDLCTLMKNECSYRNDNVDIELDCPSSMCLVASVKTGCTMNEVYEPVALVRVHFETHKLAVWNPQKIEIDRLTYDRQNTECPNERIQMAKYREAACLMTPFPDKEWTVLYFPRFFVREKPNGHFISFVNKCTYRIEKRDCLLQGSKQSDGSLCFQFLKNNSDYIYLLNSWNRVIGTWYKRFSSGKNNYDGMFQNVNTKLRRDCLHLKYESNPLKTILKNREFVLPVYYALCYVLKRKGQQTLYNELIQFHKHVKEVLDDANAIELYSNLPSRLSIDTILYCGFRTVPSDAIKGSFWEFIETGWDWIFETTTSIDEMQELLECFQDNHFPIVKGENHLYIWDPSVDKWKTLKEEHLQKKLKEIYAYMTQFKGFSKLSEALRNKLSRETDWIEKVAKNILQMLNYRNVIIKGNVPPKNLDEMSKLYGTNVPEYFFFDTNDKVCNFL